MADNKRCILLDALDQVAQSAKTSSRAESDKTALLALLADHETTLAQVPRSKRLRLGDEGKQEEGGYTGAARPTPAHIAARFALPTLARHLRTTAPRTRRTTSSEPTEQRADPLSRLAAFARTGRGQKILREGLDHASVQLGLANEQRVSSSEFGDETEQQRAEEVHAHWQACVASFFSLLARGRASSSFVARAESLLVQAARVSSHYRAQVQPLRDRASLARLREQLIAVVQDVQDEHPEAFDAHSPRSIIGRSFESQQVARVDAQQLTVDSFVSDFAMAGRPVVIRNVNLLGDSPRWTTASLRAMLGDRKVPVRRRNAESVQWARLEESGEMPATKFFDHLDQSSRAYLFDWSLPLFAPQLAAKIRIPDFFAHDFLKRTRPGTLYHDSWPSLFVGPRSTRSDLHIDAFGSNFWMHLFEGRKEWTFFAARDVPLLAPDTTYGSEPVFDVDASDPDPQDHLFACASRYRVVLEPGETLFVPAGSPHCVRNLETSVAVSANFVDLSNWHLCLRALETQANCDESGNDGNSLARDLLEQFSAPGFDRSCGTLPPDVADSSWSASELPRISCDEFRQRLVALVESAKPVVE